MDYHFIDILTKCHFNVHFILGVFYLFLMIFSTKMKKKQFAANQSKFLKKFLMLKRLHVVER